MFNLFDSDEFVSNLIGYVEIMKDLNESAKTKEENENKSNYKNNYNAEDMIEDVNYRVVDEVALLSNPSNK